MLGLKRGTVALYPHEKAWETEAARTIQTLWAILGDAAADSQLAHDIASGMDVRDALEQQRLIDYTIGDRRSNGILSDMLTDDLIARDVENGMDIGEAIAKEEFWAGFWDDLFNK